MKTDYIKKGLALAVIILFLGITISPTIPANIGKESKLFEITTEVCGIDGIRPHTVKLTKEQTNELDVLINSMEDRLDNAETREDATEIFNEALVELDRYGLLGDLSVKEAEKLVTGSYQNLRVLRRLNKNEGFFENKNFFCLVAGCTSITVVMSPRAVFLYMLSRMSSLNESIASLLSNLFFVSLEVSTFIIPILFLDIIFLGGKNNQGPFPHFVSAEGWVYSIGLTGIKSWNGSFYGDLPFPPLSMQLSQWDVYPGIFGLTGIKWCGLGSSEIFFLGSAIWLKISPDHP